MSGGRIDVHLHLLPGLDDGPTALDEALALGRRLVAAGYARVCATPHDWRGMWTPSDAAVEQERARLQAALDEAGVPLSVETGAEHRLDDRFVERMRTGPLRTLGGGPGLLIELPPGDLPQSFEHLVFELQTQGYQPVLAHPERNPEVARARPQLERLQERGVLLGVCLTSLGGKHGFWVARRAAALVQAGLCDLLSTDAHRAAEVDRFVLPGLARAERLLGTTHLQRLCVDAPRRLLDAPPPRRANP